MIPLMEGREGIWMHTAGALPLHTFEGSTRGHGVFYPLQSFTKSRELSLREVPILVEGSTEKVTERIESLAASLTNVVRRMDSLNRLWVHLAAVFANNFTNHLIHVAEEIVVRAGQDPGLLDPLIRETFLKLSEQGSSASQTGPAKRGDQQTISKHHELLKDHPEWQKMYTFISREIEKDRNG